MVRVRLTVAYDGSGFHGWAANPGVPTVADELRTKLERVLQHPVELTAAGRTDRGVHAWGQVVSFDTADPDLDLPAMQQAVNKLCGGTVVIRDAVVASPDFDARFSAHSRRYRYEVLNTEVSDPLRRATSWWVPAPLDLAAMRLACDPLIGEHDFSSFCRRPKQRPGPEGARSAEPVSLRRRVLDARWFDRGEGRLRFEIEASAFCHQMVRSIVGTVVDVGLGRRRAGEVSGILRARDRSATSTVAPPQGLCLWEVRY